MHRRALFKVVAVVTYGCISRMTHLIYSISSTDDIKGEFIARTRDQREGKLFREGEQEE